MAGVLRRLVTVVEVQAKDAVKNLRAFTREWASAAKLVDASASAIERSADRAAAAMSRISAGAANVRASAAAGAGAGGGRGGAGGAGRAPRADPTARMAARQAGLAAGAQTVNDATAALGRLATASDKAKAKVADLTAQVERNRREMADLKVQALKTGDADGTLAERMKGLSVATGQAMVQLQGARRELRAVDGGLIDTIKNVSGLKATTVALGQVMATGFTAGARAVKDGIVAAAKGAVDFESSMADVKKVLSDKDLANFSTLNQGVLDLSKNIGIAPKEVANLTAALAQSGIAGDELLKTAEDASKLAVAFGISGDEAGQAIAKLRTGLGLGRDEVNSLTGTINNLSNSLAATAPEITDAVQRVGSVAKAANLSAETTAALTTSMIASGASADIAATGTKNFIKALAAGPAATKKQAEAFAALGLDATKTAGELSKGGKEAEGVIRDVVARIGKLRDEERLPVLVELFGSESIGAIGPLATNIELLGKAFDIAGDSAAAAGSVEKEFAARSATTGAAIDKLKANIEVLAIEAGTALLPTLNRIAEWLTSPEVQEFARTALSQLKDLVVSLVPYVSAAAEAFTALGSTVLTLAGYVGQVVSVGREFTAWLGFSQENAKGFAGEVIAMQANLNLVGEALQQGRQALDAWSDGLVASADKADTAGRAFARMMLQIRGDAAALEEFDRRAAEADRRRGRENEASARKSVVDVQRRQAAERTQEAMRRDRARRRDGEDTVALDDGSGDLPGLATARAERAAAKAKGKHAGHKATKMDRQLAALSPELAGVLTRGGALDKGGDAMVHDDILSRGAFKAAGASAGLGGIGGGSGGVGPGPNITTHNYFTTITVQQAIDARSTGSVPENIRTAAYDAGTQAGNVIWTGIERAKAMKQGGGRMA